MGTHTTEYLAYGSNMNTDHLLEWLDRAGVPREEVSHPQRAILPGYRLRTNYLTTSSLGAANIEPCRGEQVEGLLLRISPAVRTVLRMKEGVSHRYEEINVEVIVPTSGNKIQAITYRVTRDHQLPFDLPVSARYRQLILDGAREARLSRDYQAHLKSMLKSPTSIESSLQLTS